MATRKAVHQLTAAQFDRHFPDEEACCAYLVAKRWPKGVKCPRCGHDEPTKLNNRPWSWQCYQCAPDTSYRFSHITGTVFENTNKPLKDWFRVIHLMLTSKKGMSALQIYRFMGFGSYKTAWYMCHRIRAALVERDTDKLGGVVEVDETYVGGKAHNKHWDKRGPDGRAGPGTADKIPVVGAVKRKGGVVARVIDTTDTATLDGFVHQAVSTKVSLLCTDEHAGYRHLGRDYPHAVIRHAHGHHVVGAVHTQTIEGFWSLIKRGIMGSYHKVSRKYLPLYVAEFSFRYNNRENPDIFGVAIEGC